MGIGLVQQKNLDEVQDNIQLVINDLNCLIRLTEEKFSYIYERLPNCERDVKLIIREVEILLNCFLYNSEASSSNDQSVIFDTLSNILMEFQQVTENFLDEELISLLSKTFLDRSSSDRMSFGELVRMSQEVEEVLAVLRDLALNSIIYSIRVGNQGAAFQVLSDHINKTSVNLGSKFDAMESTVKFLSGWNESFQSILTDFINYENNLKRINQNRFQKEFSRIIEVLKAIRDLRNDNLYSTVTTIGKVADIMVMIQNQDIIRQNIENVVKCLQILQQRTASLDKDDQEKSLDYVVFANRVLELTGLLIENIVNSLEESIFGVGQTLKSMQEALADLEIDSIYLAKLFSGYGENDDASYVLKDTFKTVFTDVIEIMEMKQQIDEKSSVLGVSGNRFYELITDMEKEFECINQETGRLKKMKVLIKIELANIDMSQEMAANIIDAVEQVIETINSNQRMFLRLREYFLKNINQFNVALTSTRSRLELSTEILIASKSKLEKVHSLTHDAVKVSGTEMRQIYSQLKEPLEHLSDTSSIKELISNVSVHMEMIQRKLWELQEHVFTKYGVSHWEEKDDDLKTLMEQFTCFVERKAMAEVTGNSEQDIGSDIGDIVLF